jgi:ubiquinone/menaquinone biosynthesis C-methylase UbiE
MTFDKFWEDNIYKKNLQVNKYPFDWVVSTINRLFSLKNNGSELRSLELGCGTGNNLKFLLEFGFDSVHGIEGSKAALQHAAEFLPNTSKIKLINADFSSIPVEDEYYNLVLDRGSITHNDLTSCNDILNEANRVLKPGGYLISNMFSSSHSELDKAIHLKQTFYQAFQDNETSSSGLGTSFFSLEEIFELFSKFEIISCVHNINEEMVSPLFKKTMWNIIAQKPIKQAI